MYRRSLEELRKWRSCKGRLPLIVRGARQVGKTWLVEEFARLDFSNLVKVNFEKMPSASRIFDVDLDPKRIIGLLEVIAGERIIPEDTLIFFDEIQDCPRALTALKYFAEDAPEYAVVAAGSILGIAEHKGLSFPVGKVNYLDLYPMSFSEFLMAVGDGPLADVLLSRDMGTIDVFGEKLKERLREYMVVGGMPAAVQIRSDGGAFGSVRTKQLEIMESYISDLSKHAPADVAVKSRQIMLSITSQLAKENKKFIFSHIREGARAREYETCFAWLESCRIVNMVNRITVPNIPIKAYAEVNAFKLFLHDVGLLSALSNLDPKVIVDGDSVYDLFKGSLTEQYALQELIASGWRSICYYSNDRSSAKIDFILQYGPHILPLEVKSGVNLKAKSLKVYREKYMPDLAIRASLLPYDEQSGLVNIPLYAICRTGDIAKQKLGGVETP